MLKVLVVDDEPLARRNVASLLEGDASIAGVTECGSGLEAIELIRSDRPDLVFLDVQMPECDGFDVLERLGNEIPSTIIFVTAHNEYALRAFEAGALDYLLKPFDDARFQRALARAKEKIARYAPRGREPLERLVVKSPGRVLFVKAEEIDWIEAADYYACLHVGDSSHLIRRTLAELEGDVGEEHFFRTHRSVIVNLRRIRGLELQSDGEYAVLLQGGARLRLSRRYRKALQERLGL